ncbi:MAG: histidine--tRNA ligase [Verrucomicrobiae bacterium]|nr:histidine--tRNA ligase [Verrucomicrobiae bacterium]
MPIQTLPGFRDFYPDDFAIRNHIFNVWRDIARRYGFREYDGPPLESLELFTKKSGDEIVGQLYNFVDKGERTVALRPEMTPTLARMVGAKERDFKKPMKWFAIPQLFRYERQQKGRLREHFQLNADIIGETDPAADAELIALLIDSLRGLDLTAEDFVVRLSSRNAWRDFFLKHTKDASKEYEFYQAIDKLERQGEADTAKKLAVMGIELTTVVDFIKASEPTPELQVVLTNLGARGLSDFVKVDYNIIRGLAYYTGVVFEAFDRKGELRAIAGGGRYDNLIKLISDAAVNLPALGFGMGDVVLTELLRERGKLPQQKQRLDAYVIIIGEELRTDALRLIHDLRTKGIAVDYPLAPQKVGKQFQAASAANARFAIVLGPDEWKLGECKVKDLTSGQELKVKLAALAEELQVPGR